MKNVPESTLLIAEPNQGSPFEVFRVFLKLGLTSFGGPIAHIGYFRDELVVRRQWIDEAGCADLVALCQFLPGPASSQAGFALGVLRGNGLLGGLAAWFAFTMPSAIILFAFARGVAGFTDLVHSHFRIAVTITAAAAVRFQPGCDALVADRHNLGFFAKGVELVLHQPEDIVAGAQAR